MRWSKPVSMAIAVATVIGLTGCQADEASSPRLAPDNALMAGYGGPPDGRGNGGGRGGGGGGDESAFGNNLSNPVVFAEGFGITGAKITGVTDYLNTGLRPLSAAEPTPFAELGTAGLPFFWTGNTPLGDGCYMQKTTNTWQAEWKLGTGAEMSARVDWGDNLVSQSFNATSVIRIENTLYDGTSSTMIGYVMDPACTSNPQSSSEMQGTKGVKGSFIPTMYSVAPHLTIDKLTGQGGSVLKNVVDKTIAEGFVPEDAEESGGPGLYAAEINVGGKLVYGYVLNMGRVLLGEDKTGWYRITFSLEPSGSVLTVPFTRGVKMTSVDASDTKAVLASDGYSTSMEFQVKASRGGKRGSGGGGGGEGDL